VLIADELLEGSLAGVVVDSIDPQLRTIGELGDEGLELVTVEVAPSWPGD
jgi:hypothetical protein